LKLKFAGLTPQLGIFQRKLSKKTDR